MMNFQNLLRTLVPSSLLLLFPISSFNAVYALPGDSPRESINFINQNLGRPSNIQKYDVSGIDSGYRGELTYRNFPLVIFIHNPAPGTFNDFSEGFVVEGGRIGSLLGNDGYNPRQDESLLDLVQNIWGEEVTQDFVTSRFTHSYTMPTLHYRNIYRGERFGYVAMYEYGSFSKTFYFRIWSLQDFWEPPLPQDFEEQASSYQYITGQNFK